MWAWIGAINAIPFHLQVSGVFRCWKDRKPYDEATYVESLRRRGSPTIEKL
jgi:hypothetical protein